MAFNLQLTCKGNGVLPINDKPVELRRLICTSSANGTVYIQEQLGDLNQQILDRLAGRRKQRLAFFKLFAGDRRNITSTLLLMTPSEIEVNFDTERASGFFQVFLELENVER